MTAVVDVLRKASGKSQGLVGRIEGLEQACEAARGRVPESVVEEAAAVVDRAAARLRLSGDHTVVALAGATGSGKSSIFNAMTGLDLAPVGVRRPTTAWALACAWGPAGAGELLDWLEIPKRHQVSRTSMLDTTSTERDLEGLVLLDLPDHDSTEVSHRLEVERLVTYADLLVWVLDPQKYADAALHERFLRPLSGHGEAMLAVLNHIDELSSAEAKATLGDVRRLLAEDGLDSVPVLATSATSGDGMADLRKTIAKRIAQKKSAKARISADVSAAAHRLAQHTGTGDPDDAETIAGGELAEACAEAAGVPVIVEAIESASLMRSRRATGWPVTKWLVRLRPDPLKRLHLERVSVDTSGWSHTPRTSMPKITPVQRARVDAAVRSVAETMSEGMAQPWSDAVRSASVARADDLSDSLDRAVAATDLGVSKDPWWWRGVNVLQWLLFVVAIVGGVWLAVLAVSGFLRVPQPATPAWYGVPVPTLMLIGGAALGVIVAGVCRLLSRWSAKRRARLAGRRLRQAVDSVVGSVVVEPMSAELEAFRACRDGVRAALRS